MIGRSAVERIRLEGLLGKPLLAADQLIDLKQAAAVLEVTVAAVRGMLDSGALRRHGGRLPLARVEVEGLALRRRNWLGVAEAAKALRVSPEEVHRSLRSGDLLRPAE